MSGCVSFDCYCIRDYQVGWAKSCAKSGCWKVIKGEITERYCISLFFDKEITCCYTKSLLGQVQKYAKDLVEGYQIQLHIWS